MIEQIEIRETAEVLNTLVRKAQENEGFKRQLMQNPRATINAFTKGEIEIPKSKNIVVVDQMEADTVYFNIPPEPNLDHLELSDEELEYVAGGISPAGYTIGLALVGLAIKGFRDGREDAKEANKTD